MILRRFPNLAEVQGLCHAVTTRHGGVSRGAYASLNVGSGSGDEAGAVAENRRRVVGALGLDAFVAPRQVHGCGVLRVDDPTQDVGDGDALITNGQGMAVAVIGADCPLVLLVDVAHRALGVVHSGWRGTVAGIVPATVETMARTFGTRPSDLGVGLGPSISAPRYEVGREVQHALAAAEPGLADAFLRDPRGRLTLDVVRIILGQLERVGVSPGRVEQVGGCTYDDAETWFSHRRDGPATGRHALVAGWQSLSRPAS